MVLDKKLYEEFRNKVYTSDFVLNKYKDAGGRNKWNCIASSIDWMNVALDYINSDWDKSDNFNIKCMNLYAYISSIDIIWEAIQQLHRVFFNTNKIPFIGEKKCFENRFIEEDDNSYFKSIRAHFGAHSVNLDDPEHPDDKKFRMFASWPFESKFFWDTGDYRVSIYSNQVGVKDKELIIKIDELNNFVLRRYNHLNLIMNEIDNQYLKFKNKMKKRKINKSNNILEWIDILISESKERLDNDYESDLKTIKLVNTIKCKSKMNEELLNNYKSIVNEVLNEISINLQNMDLVELKSRDVLAHRYPDGLNLAYAFEKLYDAVIGLHKVYAYGPIQEYLKDVIDYEAVESIEELYVLTLAGCYFKYKSTLKA